MRRRTLLIVVVCLLVLAALTAAFVWRRPIGAIEPPPRAAFAADRVRQGAALAAVGNCQGCHTTPESLPFAGGVPLPTPFGTIYGSNITPDAETGIGRWSLAAFGRALREGVGRGGEHLYPAFPYDHFTHLTDADVESLYAYFMTRDPVHASPPANELVFPLQFRPLLAGWKLLFFRGGSEASRAAGGAPHARGEYLVEALGHCSACHSPRNLLGAERRGADQAFTGGEAEGWYAPALNARSPSPLPWTVDALEHYLRTGIAEEHAMSGGPMQAVTHELAWADPGDVRAIAERVAAMMGGPSSEKLAVAATMRQRAGGGPLAAASAPSIASTGSVGEPDAATLALGQSVYVGACSACHDLGRGVSSNAALQLPLAVAVHDPDPRSLLRIVRLGIVPRRRRGAPLHARVRGLAQFRTARRAARLPAPPGGHGPGLARSGACGRRSGPGIAGRCATFARSLTLQRGAATHRRIDPSTHRHP